MGIYSSLVYFFCPLDCEAKVQFKMGFNARFHLVAGYALLQFYFVIVAKNSVLDGRVQ